MLTIFAKNQDDLNLYFLKDPSGEVHISVIFEQALR